MAGAHRPRRVMVETLTALCISVRAGRYKVIRGPVNWTTWPWEDFSYGIAIVQDSGSLFPSATTLGMRVAQISIEVFALMPEAAEALGTDEALGEELLDDVEDVLHDLIQSSKSGEVVIFNLNLPTAMFTEHYDAHAGVQGFVVTFQVTY